MASMPHRRAHMNLYVLVSLLVVTTGCSLLPGPALCEDPSVERYVATIDESHDRVLDADDRIDELIRRLNNDPALIDFPAWQDSVQTQVERIVSTSRDIEDMQQPREELAIAHQLVTGAFADFRVGAQRIAEGLDQKENSLLREGNDLLRSADRKWDGAQDELNSVLDDCQWHSGLY